MELGEATRLIFAALDAGRAAHGYLVVGDVKGDCRELVDRVLARLFPDAADQVRANAHPDVIFLEPEGKARVISVDSMRERIVAPMSQTAFSGGWKVGVISGADRLNPQSANAFLKSLEEPPPQTLYFLLTDQPDSILPTIVSRCQRIDLPPPSGLLEGEGLAAVAEVFDGKGIAGVFERQLAARHLAATLAGLIEDAEPEDVPLVRKAFFRTVMSFVRRWMVEGRLPRHQAFGNVEAVEQAYARCLQYISAEAVISFMMDRIVFP